MKLKLLKVDGKELDPKQELKEFFPPDLELPCWEFDFIDGSAMFISSNSVILWVEGIEVEEEEKTKGGKRRFTIEQKGEA